MLSPGSWHFTQVIYTSYKKTKWAVVPVFEPNMFWPKPLLGCERSSLSGPHSDVMVTWDLFHRKSHWWRRDCLSEMLLMTKVSECGPSCAVMRSPPEQHGAAFLGGFYDAPVWRRFHFGCYSPKFVWKHTYCRWDLIRINIEVNVGLNRAFKVQLFCSFLNTTPA